jgi:bifunctional DNA-binding transcriptional regulator/antitoxin component of YhaV-PrlF toxin-antitoxin module
MASSDGGDATTAEAGTTVNEGDAATVPVAVREQLALRPGDRLRWRVVDDELRVEIGHQREGVFDDARRPFRRDDGLAFGDARLVGLRVRRRGRRRGRRRAPRAT